jgi:hypothetical protein
MRTIPSLTRLLLRLFIMLATASARTDDGVVASSAVAAVGEQNGLAAPVACIHAMRFSSFPSDDDVSVVGKMLMLEVEKLRARQCAGDRNGVGAVKLLRCRPTRALRVLSGACAVNDTSDVSSMLIIIGGAAGASSVDNGVPVILIRGLFLFF